MGTRNVLQSSGPTEFVIYHWSLLNPYIRCFFSFLHCTACGHSHLIIANFVILFLSLLFFVPFSLFCVLPPRRSFLRSNPLTIPSLSQFVSGVLPTPLPSTPLFSPTTINSLNSHFLSHRHSGVPVQTPRAQHWCLVTLWICAPGTSTF